MPRFLVLSAVLCFLLCACTKEKQKPSPQPGDQDNIKVSLLSGNNQTAETGNFVTDSITIKVTNNGIPMAYCDVQFIGSGCNDDIVFQTQTGSDGRAQFLWRLAANQGDQTLNIIAVNGGTRADSVMALGNATSQSAANWVGSCTPPGMRNICLLSTGRLIANFTGPASLRYSDDNGFSWHPFNSLGSTHAIYNITTSPKDEIFAAADDRVFYSKDAGATWLSITPIGYQPSGDGRYNSLFDLDMTYTTSGKIIVTATPNNVYVSSDNGKNWTASTFGLPQYVGSRFPSELNNGDLYVTGNNYILYKSTDIGKTWVYQQHQVGENVNAIYADGNGWFYKSVANNGNTVYISKDDGLTFTPFAQTENPVMAMSVLQDGHLYCFNVTSTGATLNTFDSGLISYKVVDVLPYESYNTGGYSNRSYIIAQNHLLYISGGLLRRAN